MSTNKDNIVCGKAVLYVDGVDVGFTQGDTVFSKESDFRDIEAAQLKGKVKKCKISERGFVKTTLLESTLVNLQIAMGDMSNATNGTYLEIGSEDETEHVLRLESDAPGDTYTKRRYEVYRAISMETVEVAMRRTEETLVEVTFECLKDSDNNNKFGKITDYV